MFRWLKRKAHRHDWETVAENCWCLPTKQVCDCGARREVETHPDRMLYRWEYSDGSCGPWLRMTDGQPACIKGDA